MSGFLCLFVLVELCTTLSLRNRFALTTVNIIFLFSIFRLVFTANLQELAKSSTSLWCVLVLGLWYAICSFSNKVLLEHVAHRWIWQPFYKLEILRLWKHLELITLILSSHEWLETITELITMLTSHKCNRNTKSQFKVYT